MDGIIALGVQQFEFASLKYLWLVFLLPLLALIYWYGFYRKWRTLKKFASLESLRTIAASTSRQLRITKAVILLLAVSLLVITLMRPRGNPTEEQITREGRDVCFLLDVSNSMLAEDLKPNRLERAKLAIKDAIDIMEGDRVSLIIFAGSVALKSPLTSDYHFFKTIVNKASPENVAQGGTNIGDSIRQAVDRVLMRENTRYKDIILITDGEDLEDSFPVEAAKYAAQNNIRIHTVGLGSLDGTSVPDPKHPGRYMQYNEKTVLSRLDEVTLRKIAAATPNGTYIPVRTGTMDLGELYRKVIATAEKQQYDTEMKIKWTEWFQVPLLAAIILLIAEWFVSEHRRSGPAKVLSAFFIINICIAALTPAYADEISQDYVKEGNELYNNEKYDKSLEKYKMAEKFSPKSPEIHFNMANVHYKKGDYDQAIELYRKVLTSTDSSPQLQRKAVYNLGNCTLKQGDNLTDTNPEESLNKFRESIQHYRDTIQKAKSTDTGKEESPVEVNDAKHNIEVAKLRMKILEDKTKQQHEQKQDKRQQDLKDKLKEAIDKQKEIEDKTEQAQEQKDNNPDKDMSQQSDKLKQQQDENRERTENISSQIEEIKQEMDKSEQPNPKQQEKLSEAKQQLDKSAEEQESASKNLHDEDFEKAKEKQAEARESIEKALEELEEREEKPEQQNDRSGDEQKQSEQDKKDGEQDKEEQDKQSQAEEQQKKEGEISSEEAKQKIEEMKARFRKAREKRKRDLEKRGIRIIEGAGGIPVEKDW